MDVGPVDTMRALQKKLQCKSFDWFLKNVYPESEITDLSDIQAMGQIRNPSTNFCFDTLSNGNGGSFGAYGCHGMVSLLHVLVLCPFSF
jgi:polypeptide N-acetylgalactosaminyltransferase